MGEHREFEVDSNTFSTGDPDCVDDGKKTMTTNKKMSFVEALKNGKSKSNEVGQRSSTALQDRPRPSKPKNVMSTNSRQTVGRSGLTIERTLKKAAKLNQPIIGQGISPVVAVFTSWGSGPLYSTTRTLPCSAV
ncbi:hypothetical protein J6590_082067 [Homalodisca vitripennis]|nr:hypothetical protein J6590_082067 [Homalodisca vitripennis]